MKVSDNKQYRCSYPGCDKVFNRRDYLERHATNHLSVKPYVCVLCNRHFSRKDLYDNHLTTKRHARVSHEAEQAHYDHNMNSLTQYSHDNEGNLRPYLLKNSDTLLPYPTSQNPDAIGYLDTDSPQNSVYAPPIRQPLHHSGPGPGSEYDQVIDESSGSNYDNFSVDPTTAPSRDPMPKGNDQLYRDSTYRYYNDPLNMEFSGAKNRNTKSMEPFLNTNTSVNMNMNVNWLPRSHTRKSSVSESISQTNSTSSSNGRFSTYGVSLGLGSGTNSTASRSEASASDEYNSDLDGQTSTAIINERIRRDMVQNSHPYSGLRETPPDMDNGTGLDAQVCGPDKYPKTDVNSNSKSDNQMTPADAVMSMENDKRYAWFFDDVFLTKNAKLGYDRCYTDSVEAYQKRYFECDSSKYVNNEGFTSRKERRKSSNSSASSANSLAFSTSSITPSIVNSAFPDLSPKLESTLPTKLRKDNFNVSHTSGSPPITSSFLTPGANSLDPEKAAKVLSILHEISQNISANSVEHWIQAAWIGADAVKHILHPATFNANDSHIVLLAVLALIGMSLSEDRNVSSLARRAYAPTFLYAYESLVRLPDNLVPGRIDALTVNKLQAFSLLLRYERLVLIGDGIRFSYTKNTPGKYVTDLFLGKALAAVPHVGDFSTQKKQQPIWATLSAEGYMFHQGADPEVQWKEWTLIEATKRMVHFSLYCDSIVTLSTSKPNPVSIFNLDIHMVCPDPLWQARTAAEFFHITGPSGILTNVPYLGLIKSLIRFPRSAQNEDLLVKHDLPQVNAPWSIFALKSIAHGLIMIVGKLSGLIPHGDEMLKAVMQSRSDPNSSEDIFSKFDRQLQARLYRGLDVWYYYFSAAYGDVTDQILRVSGSMSIPLTDEFDTPRSAHSDEDGAIPHYAAIIVLSHYCSFIFVHEDLPVVLQVTANLKSWLETHEEKSLQMLHDYLYKPLYTNWIKTDEAKGMINASTLYLVWTHSVTGSVYTGNHMFLSAMIYISAIVVWLYDFANIELAQVGQQRSEVRLENYKFMDDAISYIHAVYKHVSGDGPPPKYRAINSVLLLAACLLYKRKSTKPLVEMMLQLLSVMDTQHTSKELLAVVKRSGKVYEERAAKARPTARKTTEHTPETSDFSSTASNCLSYREENNNSVNSSDIEE